MCLHQLHSQHANLNYITDRELDLAVIRSIGGRAVRPFDRALVQGLAHTGPVVANTNISDILRVRKAEGEAFATETQSQLYFVKLICRQLMQ